jgi:hypothetical protein
MNNTVNDIPTVYVVLIEILLYVYLSYSIYVIAQKTGHEDKAWMAWVPVVNTFLLIEIADKPLWWFFLLLIPIVNIVIGVIIWMKVAEARNKPNWWGILMLVPFVNFIVPGYLAFTD